MACNCTNAKDAEIAALRAEVARLKASAARIEELEAALESIMIGGNHLASALIHWLGAGPKTFPPYTATLGEARAVITDMLHRDAWVCWRAIMQARDALAKGGE